MTRSNSYSTCPVSVVIVAFHGQRWLGPCLDSLARASRDRLHVVLVDNSGNDGAIPDHCPQFEYTVIRTPEPLGFAEANNFALQHSGLESGATCFLNQDTISEPGWLDACLALFDEDSRLGAVSPLLRSYDDAGWDPGFRECASASAGFEQRAAAGESFSGLYEVPRVTAAAVVLRSDALRKSGPFDPVYGSYYEDYDLCLRIRRAGYRIGICGDGKVRHFSGSATTTEATRRKRMRQIIRNRALLRFREAGNRRIPAIARYLAGSFPRNLARSILGTPSSQPLSVQLAAHLDLVRLWKRLVSEKRDARDWEVYLKNLEWPPPGRLPLSSDPSTPQPLCPASG
jgi:GT2 family glycosyltransferase